MPLGRKDPIKTDPIDKRRPRRVSGRRPGRGLFPASGKNAGNFPHFGRFGENPSPKLQGFQAVRGKFPARENRDIIRPIRELKFPAPPGAGISRALMRRLAASWPGSSRPSTRFDAAYGLHEASSIGRTSYVGVLNGQSQSSRRRLRHDRVDGRDKPGHDAKNKRWVGDRRSGELAQIFIHFYFCHLPRRNNCPVQGETRQILWGEGSTNSGPASMSHWPLLQYIQNLDGFEFAVFVTWSLIVFFWIGFVTDYILTSKGMGPYWNALYAMVGGYLGLCVHDWWFSSFSAYEPELTIYMSFCWLDDDALERDRDRNAPLRRRPRIIAPRSNVWARCCSSILDGRNPALC